MVGITHSKSALSLICHIGIVFTNMLSYKHIFQNISSLTLGLSPRLVGRSWQIRLFVVKCATEERFSPQLSSTYCSFRGDGMDVLQGKETQGTKNELYGAALLKLRATRRQRKWVCQAEVLQVSRSNDGESCFCGQVHAASWLWAVTGKAHCFPCSQKERRKEKPPLPGE